MATWHKVKKKTISRRKGHGKIIKTEYDPSSSCYMGYHYTLFNGDGQLVAIDIDYNKLHTLLHATP